MKYLINILILVNQFRIILAYIMIQSAKTRELIWLDIDRYQSLDKIKGSKYFTFSWLLLRKAEFRGLIKYRLRRSNAISAWVFGVLFKSGIPLYINTPDIGAGIYIQHGFSTIKSAKEIGCNCYINQQVTIGYEGTFAPVIGNNVRICAGAKVISNVHVGDNSIIGANAVVVKDVPPNVTVGQTVRKPSLTLHKSCG